MPIDRVAPHDCAHGLEPLEKLRVGSIADETSILGNAFKLMANRVYEREQLLVRQVEELKIEIDETRRQKEAGGIVELQFFVDLQAKAQAMRKRRTGVRTARRPRPHEGD